jgi:ATP phosphoribosyltransferase
LIQHIRIALPKGRLLNETARLTAENGWEINNYSENTRIYLLGSGRFPDMSGKIFHEKDIPVQVAMGNYDLGICGLDWIQELMAKYGGSNLVKLKDLGYGCTSIYLASHRSSRLSTLRALQANEEVIDIASEYPNLAESLALNCRLKRFNIFPVWGAAEIYPPENADLVMLSAGNGDDLYTADLVPVTGVLKSSAYLIANKISWETKDLSQILNNLRPGPISAAPPAGVLMPDGPSGRKNKRTKMPVDSVRLALPDGHAQKHVVNVLSKANIKIKDYSSGSGNRRPEIELTGVSVKVIRPQDMPLQVANGKFDIAITGQDWVREHRYQFPSSPVEELADLKYSRVRIVAAIHDGLPVDDIGGIRRLAAEKGWRLRIASEYVRIADRYARDNHLGMYCIIPTWGATEAFLPDDADLLIENTETGSTLARNNLKIVDTLFESTACLIANKASLLSRKGQAIKSIAETLRKAVEEG